MNSQFNDLVSIFIKNGFSVELSNIITCVMFGLIFFTVCIFLYFIIFSLCILIIDKFMPKTYNIYLFDNGKFLLSCNFTSKIISHRLEKKYNSTILFIHKFKSKDIALMCLLQMDYDYDDSVDYDIIAYLDKFKFIKKNSSKGDNSYEK